MIRRPLSWLRGSQAGLLAECLAWALVVGAIYAGIGTITDLDRFEPETFDEYWDIGAERWVFLPDYLAWIGLPLVAIVWAHSRYVGNRRLPSRRGDEEYRIFDSSSSGPRSAIETFAYLYLGAMVIAGLRRFAIIRCFFRGECSFFTWHQGLLYSAVFLIWPLVFLLM